MTNLFEFNAEQRNESGKSATRRLRHQLRVPATVYGGGKAPQSVSLVLSDLMKSLENESVYSHILTLKVAGQSEKVVLKKIQRHHTKREVTHIDFLRVKSKEKLTMKVPLHYEGEEDCPGVKAGGVVSRIITEVDIRCLPGDLPESISVDVSAVELDQSLHLSDIQLTQGVEFANIADLDDEHNLPIFNVHMPKVAKEDLEAEAAEAAEAEAADEADEKAQAQQPTDEASADDKSKQEE